MRKTANSSRIIKKANESLVLSTLQKNDPLSVEEIASLTRLSRPTILNILKDLDAQQLIMQAGFGESAIGRQPMLYTLNLSSHFAVGVDMEYPPVRVVISDLREKILFSQEWENHNEDSMQDIVDDICSAIQTGMQKLGITAENILGIGFGLPGVVDIKKNQPVFLHRVQQWKHEDLASRLSSKIGAPVIVRNDIHMLAASEIKLHADMPQDFIYVARRVGIGMAVFIKGRSYEGMLGNSGLLGHTIADPLGDVCCCGNRGCLETYATVTSIEKNYKKLKRPQMATVRYAEILEAAHLGEPYAAQICNDAAAKMAIAIFNATQLYDIPNVILCDCDDEEGVFFSLVREQLEQLSNSSGRSNLKITKGKLTSKNFALGGCSAVLKSFFNKTPQLKVES